jgi:uncharacterized protein (DUF433 family)
MNASSHQPDSVRELLGVGLYTKQDVAQILQMPVRRVGRWSNGYDYATKTGVRHTGPVFERDFRDFSPQTILSFADMIEMRFIDWFLQNGVKRRVVMDAHAQLSQRYHTTHPFAFRQVQTDGTNLYNLIGGEGDEAMYEDANTWQLVMTQIAQDFFRKLEYGKNDIAMRYWPLGRDRRVVLDPRRSFGKPIENKSGVPTYIISSMSDSGEDAEAIADWYSVDVQGVLDAIEYEKHNYPLA